MIALLILAALLGLLPASIARSKGRGIRAWWMYGAALFIVALPQCAALGRRCRVRPTTVQRRGPLRQNLPRLLRLPHRKVG
jgi:hypothetical protein